MVDGSKFRVVTRYMGSGNTSVGSEITGFGITAARSGITSHGIRISKIATVLGSGIRILGEKMKSLTKKYTSLRPCFNP